ncbi:hypothetical protein [Spirosoma endophyticum]|uniref:Uncharacterized protein n=1 Tax=Spirosoma endophyticum TaxID=662367 RepID=A0A1I1YG13_9BACT|nr:hypothetical protein [Spirosoma endophyticum]SFE18545.1 hypothetical protein SAMN05216167_11151 [Spirosoma endophyticum]
MQPIRYIIHQNTVWYNVMDYARLLLDTRTIARVRPSVLHKRHRSSKLPEELLMAKLTQLSATYQLRINQEVFADWVVFEHLHRVLKPFLVQPSDWTNPASLFYKIRVYIDRPKRSVEPNAGDDYFEEIIVEASD